jgi:hypothetical protein
MRIDRRFPACMAAFSFVLPLGASIIPAVTDEELVKGADMIFAGQVVRVDYRKAGFRTILDAPLPHTFVTFQVETLLKGKYTGTSNQFTMRLLGGPDTASARFMTVEGCPDFDIGERGIIFVRRNERSICPITGWGQGRFRIVDGALYNDSGREVWLTPQKRLAAGLKRDLAEVKTHNRGGNVFAYRVSGPNNSEGSPVTRPMQGTRLTVTGFLNYISGLVNTLYTASDLSRLEAVNSADPNRAFYMKQPSEVGDPALQK